VSPPLVAADRASAGPEAAPPQARLAWLFLAPLLTALALTAGWPLLRTVFLSLTDAGFASADGWRFIGLENYLALAQDHRWWSAVRVTILFVAVSVAIETLLGLAIALVLNARIKGRGALRAAMLIPWAIPTVVSAKMWAWMLNDLNGVVNAALAALGLISAPVAWLADPALSLTAIVAIDVWKATPFMALLSLAALQSIPDEILESARIDGAGPVRTFFSITLPIISSALLVAVLFRALDALRVFDVIYVLTGSNAATATMSIYARQQLIEFQDAGFGSAAATCLFLVGGVIAVIVITAARLDLEPRREVR
jgi:trehalose/maltose transport system permease protein